MAACALRLPVRDDIWVLTMQRGLNGLVCDPQSSSYCVFLLASAAEMHRAGYSISQINFPPSLLLFSPYAVKSAPSNVPRTTGEKHKRNYKDGSESFT